MSDVQILDGSKFSFANSLLRMKYKDTGKMVVNEDGTVPVVGGRGSIQVNSLLRKDEWEELDTAIVQAASERLNAIQRLQELNLVKRLGSIGVLASQWNVGSQVTRPSVSLEGTVGSENDRQDYNLKGVPVPVIRKDFTISERQLQASRAYGDGIDTTNAYEASRVVAEELERLFFAGNTELTLNGQSLYGVTNEPNINTGSATGDFGTISNIGTTFTNMLAALAGDNYHGPFEAWVSTTQYNEMITSFYTDGSGESAYERMLRIPTLRAIHPGDYLTDGSLVIVQMTPNVVDLALYEMGMTVEWTSGDGMNHAFSVMTIAAPRIKSDYEGQSGVAYYTGA